MRFISDGPAIPDFLLEQRDLGKVVFLCGAGVSIPAGMPTFVELTRLVVARLSPTEASGIPQALLPWLDPDSDVPVAARISLDQIFNLLQQEYGRDVIGGLVSECLATTEPAKIRTTEHDLICRISADQHGIPQIVTTNFDHLFEHALAGNSFRTFVPPTFPDLRHGVSLTGITYLHGRLSDVDSGAHEFVLSSSDFGRAYLAQGWATSFIRQLLMKYTVVLLGYQAEDPPVKYLLQGLNSSSDHAQGRLFAFDSGRADEIEARWKDKGVTPIAYGDSHQALWDTLDAWATRADDPTAWRTSAIELSQNDPGSLKPHERGIVAHLVRSAVGAKMFSEAEPAPPLEWLCVFDKTCRFAKPSKSMGEEKTDFDPLETYGLDDDPPRPPKGGPDDGPVSEDLIAWRSGDGSLDHEQRLAGGTIPSFESIPARLFHLSKWMMRHLEQPMLAWWVARQYRLHPRLHAFLRRAVEDTDRLDENARNLWMIIFEALESPGQDTVDMDWFQVRRRIKMSGWTSSVLRDFAAATEPKFRVEIPFGLHSSKPPAACWSQVEWNNIANLEIHFPSQHGERPEIPDSALSLVYMALEQNLRRASERLDEAQQRWFRLNTFYPEISDNDDRHIEDQNSYVQWFLQLLDQMVIASPTLLRAHIETWPDPDRFFFDKLRLYVWNKTELFSGSEVAGSILDLDDGQFWRSDDDRELLILLRDRWPDFSSEQKESIANRILEGRPKYEREEESKYKPHRDTQSAIIFGWLLNNSCDVTETLRERWEKMKDGLPDWHDTWIDGAASSNEPRAGWVATNDDASVLSDVPVWQIVEVAKENTRRPFSEFTVYKPFLGLVENDPTRAIAALGAAARRNEYPVDFWADAISKWPETASEWATKLLQERMCRLPDDVISEIGWAIGDWLRDEFPKLYENDPDYSFKIYDSLVAGLMSVGADAMESGLGETFIGGEQIQKSRRTINHAINAPMGKATEGLLSVLGKGEIVQNAGLPTEFTSRVERLLATPGEGSDHAVCVLSQRVNWLNYIDPTWVTKRMMTWFNLEHPASEPAWNGILFTSDMPSSSVFIQIKEFFLQLFPKIYSWNWNDSAEERAHDWVVLSSVFHSNELPGLTFDEARSCLRKMKVQSLRRVIWFLGRVGKENDDGWRKYVLPFIDNAWPKESRFQTEKTSGAWISLFDNTEDAFPEILAAVRGFLRPVNSDHLGLYRFHREMEGTEPLTTRLPKETIDFLDLIIPDAPRNAPYELPLVLNLLAETEPNMVSDPRFQRLQTIVATR